MIIRPFAVRLATINKTGPNLATEANICNIIDLDYSLYTIECFAISTEEGARRYSGSTLNIGGAYTRWKTLISKFTKGSYQNIFLFAGTAYR